MLINFFIVIVIICFEIGIIAMACEKVIITGVMFIITFLLLFIIHLIKKK